MTIHCPCCGEALLVRVEPQSSDRPFQLVDDGQFDFAGLDSPAKAAPSGGSLVTFLRKPAGSVS